MLTRTEARKFLIKKAIIQEVVKQIREGGSGSGNWGHKGRKGKRGGSTPGKAAGIWSSRKTVELKLSNGDIVSVDAGMKNIVDVFNKVGLKTAQSCSGHSGSSVSAETYLSFMHTGESKGKLEAIRKLVDGKKLQVPWALEDKAGGSWHAIYPSGGFFGTGKLASTDSNLSKIKHDLKLFEVSVRGNIIKETKSYGKQEALVADITNSIFEGGAGSVGA